MIDITSFTASESLTPTPALHFKPSPAAIRRLLDPAVPFELQRACLGLDTQWVSIHKIDQKILGVRAFEHLGRLRLLGWFTDGQLFAFAMEVGRWVWKFKGHTDAVKGVRLFHGSNGPEVLSWSTDRTLRRWELGSGLCLQAFEGHAGPVEGARLFEDHGRSRVLSWSTDETLKIWNRENGHCLQTFEGHTGPVRGARLWKGEQVISWSDDGTLKAWNCENGSCLQTFAGHSGPVRGAKLWEGNRVISWSDDGTLKTWNGESGACLQTFARHAGPVRGLHLFKSRGEYRALSWAEDRPRVWNVESGECLAQIGDRNQFAVDMRIFHHRENAMVLSYHRSSDPMAIWEAESGREVSRFGESSCRWDAQIFQEGDQSWIISWEGRATIAAWSVEGGNCMKQATQTEPWHAHEDRDGFGTERTKQKLHFFECGGRVGIASLYDIDHMIVWSMPSLAPVPVEQTESQLSVAANALIGDRWRSALRKTRARLRSVQDRD